MGSFISRFLPMIRLLVLSILSLFGLIVMAVNASYTSTSMHTQLFVDGFQTWPVTTADPFAALNMAVGIMTMLTVPALIAIDFLRRGAFTSLIIFELCWLGFLDILWLAAAAYTADIYPPFGSLCSNNPSISSLQSACGNVQAGLAFAWLSWIMLSAYIGTLLALAIISANYGRPVWKSTVKDAEFTTSSGVPSAGLSVYSGPDQYSMKTQNTPYDPHASQMPYGAPGGARYAAEV